MRFLNDANMTSSSVNKFYSNEWKIIEEKYVP